MLTLCCSYDPAHATKSASGIIFCSGQIGQDANGKLPDGVEAQCVSSDSRRLQGGHR